MALVPWTYSNPHVDRAKLKVQQFIFQGHLVELPQDNDAEIDVTKNTGLRLWDGAYLLARYMESGDFGPGYWTGKRCLELGAGCGLVGIVAWLLGAQVTLTDLKDTLPHTRDCLSKNTNSVNNRNSADISAQVFEWGAATEHISTPLDVILGSDIVYQPQYIDDLVKTLEDLTDSDTLILLSYKKRGLGEHTFFDKMRKHFHCSEASRDNFPADFCESPYIVYRFTKR